MAEFDGLDGRLRDALGRAAERGDSTGVADAIRARVAAGDPGASVAASTAPGWGGGVLGWLPWLGLIVVTGIVGSVLGWSGVLTPASAESVTLPATVEVGVTGAACPAGPPGGSVDRGARVLAVARSDDGAWLGVRDPADVATVVWFERDLVVLDDAQPDVDALPVVACPEVIVEPLPVDPEPEPTEEPQPEPGPRDSTPPSVLRVAVVDMGCQTSQVINVEAIDDVGVSSVVLSWTGPVPGSAVMSGSGSTWSYTYTAPSSNNYENYTFTATALDTGGNSGSRSASITIACIG